MNARRTLLAAALGLIAFASTGCIYHGHGHVHVPPCPPYGYIDVPLVIAGPCPP